MKFKLISGAVLACSMAILSRSNNAVADGTIAVNIDGGVDSSGYPTITATVGLVDPVTGRPLTEVGESSITVEDDSGSLSISSVSVHANSKNPVAYVILVDTGSTMQSHMEQAKGHITKLLSSFGPNDIVRFIKFNSGVDITGTNWVRKDDINLLEQIELLQSVEEEVSLVVPAYVRAAEVANSAPAGYVRRAVIGFVSIEGVRSESNLNIDVIAQRINVTTFTFAFGVPPVDSEHLSFFLQDVADYNGGAYWPVAVPGIPSDLVSVIATVMRSTWTVEFIADELPDGGQHEFRVGVVDPLQRRGEVEGQYVSGKLGSVSPIDVRGLAAGEDIETDRYVVASLGGGKTWDAVSFEIHVDCQPPRCDRAVASGDGVVQWKLRASDFAPGRHKVLVAVRVSGAQGEFTDSRSLEFTRSGASWDLAPAVLVLGVALVAAVTTVGLARRRAARD